MKIAKYRDGDGVARVALVESERLVPLAWNELGVASLSELLEQPDILERVGRSLRAAEAVSIRDAELLPPIDSQEVWAAGVTYQRSQVARMEESEAAADCYDRVYASPRPELFLKATPNRVVGPEQPVRVRYDSNWSVPEPEITLVLTSQLRLVGFTVGNDMSARDIEGENPLYLPQAKVYAGCCALGPWVTLADAMPNRGDITIAMQIEREGQTVFDGATSVAQMARSFEDLIQWLGRENEFPNGAFLLTGTGIVPPNEFTLQDGDQVAISVSGIGTLVNPVVKHQPSPVLQGKDGIE